MVRSVAVLRSSGRCKSEPCEQHQGLEQEPRRAKVTPSSPFNIQSTAINSSNNGTILLPTRHDFDPTRDCRDANHAWEMFGGLTFRRFGFEMKRLTITLTIDLQAAVAAGWRYRRESLQLRRFNGSSLVSSGSLCDCTIADSALRIAAR